MAAQKASPRVDKLAALRAKIQNTDIGAGSAGFWSPEEGNSIIRIMPDVHTMEYFFQVVGRHFFPSDGKNGAKKMIYCPDVTSEGEYPCPVCEMVDRLRNGKPADKILANELKARKSFWMNVIVRGKEKMGPQIYTPGPMVFGPIAALIADPDYGDITDPVNGIDLTIERTGKGIDTEYGVRPRRNSSPLTDDPDLLEKWMNSAKDLKVVYLTDDPEEDQAIIAGHSVYVLPYDRIVTEYNLGEEDELDDDDEEPEEAPVRKPVTKSKTVTRKPVVEEPEEPEDDEEPEEEDIPEPPAKAAVASRMARRSTRR